MEGFDKSATKKKLIITGNRLLTMVKWLVIGTAIGLIVGAVSSAFSFCLSYVTQLRSEYPYIVYGLPIGGLAIVGLYKLAFKDKDIGTNGVIDSISNNPEVPAKVAPLIFVGTTITHLFGGSAGREGAALQLGGSLGCMFGQIFKMNKYDRKIMIMAGMSAAFAALFGTPMAAAVFAVEAATVGSLYIASLLPCVVSAIVACQFSASMGISPESFPLTDIPHFGVVTGLKIVLLAVLTGLLSILFCLAMKYIKIYMAKLIKNHFLRVIAASAVFLIITTLIGGSDYYGAGIPVIERAVTEGEAVPYAFIVKMLLTAIIMGSGFKGGEIVPAFFVGATFGCVYGHIMGISPGVCAAMGMTAMFCGITNCPITSMLISFELFGFECIPFIVITAAVSFVASGYVGIYSSQRFMYSKYRPKFKNNMGE
ncbi:MAG: chloride channel protein [Butyrivibrio sp.]